MPQMPAKAAARVAIYTHKDPSQMLRLWAGERIHRVEALELYRVDRGLIDALVAALDRRMTFSLSVHDRELYVALGELRKLGLRTVLTHVPGGGYRLSARVSIEYE